MANAGKVKYDAAVDVCRHGDGVLLIASRNGLGFSVPITPDQCLELEQKLKAIREAKP